MITVDGTASGVEVDSVATNDEASMELDNTVEVSIDDEEKTVEESTSEESNADDD